MQSNQSLSIRDQTCPRSSCAFFRIKFAANIVSHGSKNRRFKCKTCGKTWVEHYQKSHYGLRSDFEKIIGAITMFNQGASIRIIAQKIKVSPTTIQRWKKKWKQ